MSVDVSILIVSHNTVRLLLECLESLQTQKGGLQWEILVLDNASQDGSSGTIRSRFPHLFVVDSTENLGFAGGNNSLADRAQGEFLLLLNPDTVVLGDAIERVVEFARKHPDTGIVGGRTFYADGSLNYSSCHGSPTLWSMLCMGLGVSSLFRQSRLFDPESLGSWRRDTVREVDAVTGCFFLIRRSLWQQLGGFDESFFMYGEETDLCMRARRLGYKCMICPQAELIHYGGASERVRADKMVKLFRAKARLIEKHWSPAQARFGKTMLKTWALTRMLGTGVLCRFNPRRRDSFEAWRDIWRRRSTYAT